MNQMWLLILFYPTTNLVAGGMLRILIMGERLMAV